ncbi:MULTISPECIES: putative adenosine monophosphate-protein transferase Fic [Pseudomonas]|uniref:putative adenosine monophosphate-protein transferase Fic n=1 Tax=Pseudomonas TaxID=286 RepID=UPI000C8895C3|nr:MULTISPECIES: putative adenosine monophosphate-protein transferase Fic [Pseudomonas]MDF9756082.1 cell filamentation protein [Pseudomonas hunanensis]PMZ92804.1 cell filamentation protein Fic [Pseudomonas sp. FW305-42]PNA27276.1 cell filamentation protein Fic [Pseudomonas sp. MPR-R1B]PNB26988.1 cell filamentation protein Fic [Pseudomonas sp. DP16D-E2]PNB44003.1 cell filamentation protein Fic [Pseudomonas sp. FW305-17]
MDKYGVGQDAYCYAGTSVLRNRLDVHDDDELCRAERDFSELAASEIEFSLPPYDLAYLKQIHRSLFRDVYDWAGELRVLDISKGQTRFCNLSRIKPEADKIFALMAERQFFEGHDRDALVKAVAESFGDLNMVHPFREGNGRAQRILFEHLLLNAGFQIDWWQVEPDAWIEANIAAIVCDYSALERIFDRCLGLSMIK